MVWGLAEDVFFAALTLCQAREFRWPAAAEEHGFAAVGRGQPCILSIAWGLAEGVFFAALALWQACGFRWLVAAEEHVFFAAVGSG